MICKHCGEGIREATADEYESMGWDSDQKEYKHAARDRWGCKDAHGNYQDAEPLVDPKPRWNTPKEELDLSMIGDRRPWEIIRSTMQFHLCASFPSSLEYVNEDRIRDWQALQIIMGICIELAKESLGGGE